VGSDGLPIAMPLVQPRMSRTSSIGNAGTRKDKMVTICIGARASNEDDAIGKNSSRAIAPRRTSSAYADELWR
jgi:hypothetical protein